MNPSEGLKRLLHSRLNHYLHIYEQTMTSQIDEYADLALELGITTFPTNMTNIHVIDCIGNNEPINSTAIAEKLNMSKANVTKISTKLLKEGCIKRSQMNDNKKEVYFSLSSKGRQIFEVHNMMHEAIEHRFISVLDSFSESELQASLKFLQALIDQTDNIVMGTKEHDGGISQTKVR